jgi:predicted RNA binding protein YcfA (HicA-like mRNA interferase family)
MTAKPMTPNKDLMKVLREMMRAGYIVEKSNGSHLKITNPTTGGIVFIASTPRGGNRTYLNILRDLKRIGWPQELPETV